MTFESINQNLTLNADCLIGSTCYEYVFIKKNVKKTIKKLQDRMIK